MNNEVWILCWNLLVINGVGVINLIFVDVIVLLLIMLLFGEMKRLLLLV